MKLIVITQPEFFEDEAAAITSLFDAGLEILHLRKPGASYEDMDKLLRRLPAEYMERIVTHDHFGLASERNLKGVHLNRRNPAAPAGFTGHVSRSCHSLEKVAEYPGKQIVVVSHESPIWSYRHMLETGHPEHNMLLRHTALASITSITYDCNTGKIMSITYADPAADVE